MQRKWWKVWFEINHQLIITQAKKMQLINALPQNFFASEESAVLQRDKTARSKNKYSKLLR